MNKKRCSSKRCGNNSKLDKQNINHHIENNRIEVMQVPTPCTTTCVSSVQSCSIFTIPDGYRHASGVEAVILVDPSGLSCSVQPCEVSGTLPIPCGAGSLPVSMDVFQFLITGSIYLNISIPVINTACPPTSGFSGYLTFTDTVPVNIVRCITKGTAPIPCPTGCLLELGAGPLRAPVTVRPESPLECSVTPGVPTTSVQVVEVSPITFNFVNLCPTFLAACTNADGQTLRIRTAPTTDITVTQGDLIVFSAFNSGFTECTQGAAATIVGVGIHNGNIVTYSLDLNSQDPLNQTAKLTLSDSTTFDFTGCNDLIINCPVFPPGSSTIIAACIRDSFAIFVDVQQEIIQITEGTSNFFVASTFNVEECTTDTRAVVTGIGELSGSGTKSYRLVIVKNPGPTEDQILINFEPVGSEGWPGPCALVQISCPTP